MPNGVVAAVSLKIAIKVGKTEPMVCANRDQQQGGDRENQMGPLAGSEEKEYYRGTDEEEYLVVKGEIKTSSRVIDWRSRYAPVDEEEHPYRCIDEYHRGNSCNIHSEQF